MKINRYSVYDVKWEEVIGKDDDTEQGFVVRIDGIPVIDAGFFAQDLTISIRVRNTDDVFLKEIEPFVDEETGIVIDRRFQLVSMPNVKEVPSRYAM